MSEGSGRNFALIVSAVTCLFAAASIGYASVRRPHTTDSGVELTRADGDVAAATGEERYERRTAPDRTVLVRGGVTLAIMTDGSRTVRLVGPQRVFAEPRFTRANFLTNLYVRLAPEPWKAGSETQPWFTAWLATARVDESPDVLAVAMEYIYGAAPGFDAQGRQIRGDASFGPLSDADPDGRAENSDFYDYLGVPWEFTDGPKERPDPGHLRSLDCSGFLRMVYGFRLGYPLRGTNTAGPGLPRRAYAMAEFGPGVQLMPNTGRRPTDLDVLLAGDLLFFNTGPVAGANVEHSGIYLGVDDRGHHRFISSRSVANGPTMGDMAGESILDGTGYWASRFRTARRL